VFLEIGNTEVLADVISDRITCAGVFPCASPMATIVSSSSVLPVPPSR
jgi:hypothetical protein